MRGDGEIEIPSHLSPSDFNWQQSRPLKPWRNIRAGNSDLSGHWSLVCLIVVALGSKFDPFACHLSGNCFADSAIFRPLREFGKIWISEKYLPSAIMELSAELAHPVNDEILSSIARPRSPGTTPGGGSAGLNGSRKTRRVAPARASATSVIIAGRFLLRAGFFISVATMRGGNRHAHSLKKPI